MHASTDKIPCVWRSCIFERSNIAKIYSSRAFYLSKINAYMCVCEYIYYVHVYMDVCVCVCVYVYLLGLCVVVHYVNFCYPQNSTSWVLSNLAALYWRVVGQGQLAIKCLKHSLYYSNEYTRVSQSKS